MENSLTELARDFYLRTKENVLRMLSILAFINITKQLCPGKTGVEEIGSRPNSKDAIETVPSRSLLDPDFQICNWKGEEDEVIKEAVWAGSRDLIKQGVRERKYR